MYGEKISEKKKRNVRSFIWSNASEGGKELNLN